MALGSARHGVEEPADGPGLRQQEEYVTVTWLRRLPAPPPHTRGSPRDAPFLVFRPSPARKLPLSLSLSGGMKMNTRPGIVHLLHGTAAPAPRRALSPRPRVSKRAFASAACFGSKSYEDCKRNRMALSALQTPCERGTCKENANSHCLVPSLASRGDFILAYPVTR